MENEFLDWVKGKAPETEKHQMGKHNQKLHGRRGGGSAEGESVTGTVRQQRQKLFQVSDQDGTFVKMDGQRMTVRQARKKLFDVDAQDAASPHKISLEKGAPKSEPKSAPKAKPSPGASDRRAEHDAKVKAGAGKVNEGWKSSAYGETKSNLANKRPDGVFAIAHVGFDPLSGRYGLIKSLGMKDNFMGSGARDVGRASIHKAKFYDTEAEARRRAMTYLTTPIWMPSKTHPRGE